jgi:hypothetical protein
MRVFSKPALCSQPLIDRVERIDKGTLQNVPIFVFGHNNPLQEVHVT